jgi:hypothetical protein
MKTSASAAARSNVSSQGIGEDGLEEHQIHLNHVSCSDARKGAERL